MSFMLTRMFAYFTLLTYLVVGTVAVRLILPETTTVTFSKSYLNAFKKYEVRPLPTGSLEAPEIAFEELSIPAPVTTVKVRKAVVKAPKQKELKQIVVKAPELKMTKVAPNELPFGEPVKLQKVVMAEAMPMVASLYVEFKYEMVAQNEVVEDEVGTSLAASEEVEPEFFDYTAQAPKKETTQDQPSDVPAKAEKTQAEVAAAPVEAELPIEEVGLDELVSFDYSKAQEEIKEATLTVSGVSTQVNEAKAAQTLPVIKKSPKKKIPVVTTHPGKKDEAMVNSFKSALLPTQEEVTSKFPSRVTIQLSGTDLNEVREEVGFEVRFQDDLNETSQDYNNGSITLDQELSQKRMTRSLTVLKRGYAPTNTDLILEEGVSEISLPVIEEQKFNELMAPYESRGPIGAVLVELDEKVEEALLDVPYSQTILLDGDLKPTEAEDFRYQLFIGVKAGNALLSYREASGTLTSKIIHVHEREVTFETNFFETITDEKIRLWEEDLLSKEKTPLIISSQEVKQFATEKTSKKLNNHTYQMEFNKTLLGGRRYLELTHQEEPIFVGIKDNTSVSVPSENFMRFILSRFENSNLGNRCLVQVNLSRMATKVDVGTESTAQSLMTYTQVLDSDGKFYDSVGAKTRKIIIVGEHQGAPELGQDGKINVKITYADGTNEFVASYCSPNTYLVEQL